MHLCALEYFKQMQQTNKQCRTTSKNDLVIYLVSNTLWIYMNATMSFNNVSILQCSFSKRGNKQIQQLSTTVIICRSVPTSLDVLDIFWMVTGPIGVSWLNSLFDCCYFYWLFAVVVVGSRYPFFVIDCCCRCASSGK